MTLDKPVTQSRRVWNKKPSKNCTLLINHIVISSQYAAPKHTIVSRNGCNCSLIVTDKRTNVWPRDFLTWKINFGLWAVAWAGLWEKRV